MHVAIVRQPLLLVVDLVFTAAWFAWHIQHCERNAVKTFKQLASSQDWTASMVDYGVLAVHWCTWQTNGHRTFFAVSVGSIELLRCTVSNKTCIALRTNEVSLHQCAWHLGFRTCEMYSTFFAVWIGVCLLFCFMDANHDAHFTNDSGSDLVLCYSRLSASE